MWEYHFLADETTEKNNLTSSSRNPVVTPRISKKIFLLGFPFFFLSFTLAACPQFLRKSVLSSLQLPLLGFAGLDDAGLILSC